MGDWVLLRVSYAGRVAQAEEFGWMCAGTMRQALVLAAPGSARASRSLHTSLFPYAGRVRNSIRMLPLLYERR
jgi:hypothetical protein